VGAGVSQSVLEMAQLIQQRCAQILGFEPTLQRVQGAVDEQHVRLIYQVARLAEINFNVYPDNIKEIDQLLNFCKLSFNQMSNE
jgi:UDP-glucose 4-epimerase